MELKDMILSTLAELDMDEKEKLNKSEERVEEPKKEVKEKVVAKIEVKEESETLSEEKIFLTSVRERVLVLFEGLQSPKNENIDKKLDITLNFLEFLLASIEKRLQKVK